MRLRSSIDLGSEIGRRGSKGEEAGEKGLEERVEDNFGSAVEIVRSQHSPGR